MRLGTEVQVSVAMHFTLFIRCVLCWSSAEGTTYPHIHHFTLLGIMIRLIGGMAPLPPFLSLHLLSASLCPSLCAKLSLGDESSSVLVGFNDRCSLIHFLEVGQTAEFIFTLIYSVPPLFLSLCTAIQYMLLYLLIFSDSLLISSLFLCLCLYISLSEPSIIYPDRQPEKKKQI